MSPWLLGDLSEKTTQKRDFSTSVPSLLPLHPLRVETQLSTFQVVQSLAEGEAKALAYVGKTAV